MAKEFTRATLIEELEARPKLHHVQKIGSQITVTEVPCARDSLNEGDAFVLDAGSKIYVWCGEHSSPHEKTAANLFAENTEAKQGSGNATTTHDIDDMFWNYLGGKGPIRLMAAPGLLEASRQVEVSIPVAQAEAEGSASPGGSKSAQAAASPTTPLASKPRKELWPGLGVPSGGGLAVTPTPSTGGLAVTPTPSAGGLSISPAPSYTPGHWKTAPGQARPVAKEDQADCSALTVILTAILSISAALVIGACAGFFVQANTVTKQEAAAGVPFQVLHYNVLGKSLGDNREPWFLYPLNATTLPEELRQKLLKNYAMKDANGKLYNNFANGFGGLLDEKLSAEVAEYQKYFLWENRKPLIYQVVASDADIISLVQNDQFEEIKDNLTDYDGSFTKRPGKEEGSSILWRRERFELLGKPRGEVVALRDLKGGSVLVVSSFYLPQKPYEESLNVGNVMLIDAMMADVKSLVKQHGASGFMVLGDFGNFPNSNAYIQHLWQLLCESTDSAFLDEQQANGDGLHPAHVTSVFKPYRYAKYGDCTAHTSAGKLWTDYMFYSGSSMEIAPEILDGNEVVRFSHVQMDKCPSQPIPDATHGSDHLPLQVTLRFTLEKKATPLECNAGTPTDTPEVALSDDHSITV